MTDTSIDQLEKELVELCLYCGTQTPCFDGCETYLNLKRKLEEIK